MNKYLNLICICLVTAVTLVLGGCDDEEDKWVSIHPTETYLSFDMSGGLQAVTLKCDDDWYIDTDVEDWVTVSPTSGPSGKNMITIVVESNLVDGKLGDSRTALIYFYTTGVNKKSYIMVEQEGRAFFSFSQSSLNFDVNGGSETVTFTTDADAWTAEYPEWLTVTPSSGGSGGNEIVVSASANYTNSGEVNSPRYGEINFIVDSLVIATIDVSQEGDS